MPCRLQCIDACPHRALLQEPSGCTGSASARNIGPCRRSLRHILHYLAQRGHILRSRPIDADPLIQLPEVAPDVPPPLQLIHALLQILPVLALRGHFFTALRGRFSGFGPLQREHLGPCCIKTATARIGSSFVVIPPSPSASTATMVILVPTGSHPSRSRHAIVALIAATNGFISSPSASQPSDSPRIGS